MLIIARAGWYNGIMKYSVSVKLHSKLAPKVIETAPGELTVHINAKPHDGEANKELIKLISKHFKAPKTKIKILTGEKSRQKVLDIPKKPMLY